MISSLINMDHLEGELTACPLHGQASFFNVCSVELFPTACHLFLQKVSISPVRPPSQFSFQRSFVKLLVQGKEKRTTS